MRENLTSSSYGEGLETSLAAPHQSFTRQVFFRWIKQHLNIPTLFGTTENAVYGQLFAALMVYVLLNGCLTLLLHPYLGMWNSLLFDLHVYSLFICCLLNGL
ncbi:hypothetical protein [Paenibacillus sp. MZ04-78.2]|uniref:hypothetical protein n=1 Tax=Paenibacillus sp. MZ04-78.2 TaxID=2962034 RepID=UPI0035CAC68F